MHTYLDILRDRSACLAVIANILAATGIGAFDLGVVLYVQTRTGSLALAGLIAGALTVGNAAGLTLQSQLIDRIGSRRVVPVCGLGCAPAAFGLVAVPPDRTVALLALAFIGGLLLPAVTTAARPAVAVVQRRAGTAAGYALLSLTFQLGLTAGPLLVAAVIAALDPGRSVRISGILLAASGLIMIMVSTEPHLVGPTDRRWSSDLLRLLTVTTLLGLAAGMIRIGVPGFTTGSGGAELAGLLLSAAAIGNIVGCLGYGARRWPRTQEQQLRAAVALSATMGALITAAVIMNAFAQRPGLLLIGTLLLLFGLAGAPTGIITSVLIDRVVPSDAVARGYAAMVSCSLVSSALGSGAGGYLAEALGEATPFAAATVVIIAALACTRRSYGQQPAVVA